ncbi:uncharacterized protein BT62DRAFT_965923 [Guyanagaster necrorhizus]|uniref:Shieldin complex subunit 2 first OB fold domain-containing protein n=1 Tax=Guyanagaster necrorhizus TaxID=856835 RepID=A0A9P7VWP0_9AGAR|nr:uncharacterized protein BT62DRAFT_965923 [Guyanagaster necrorhizus MCA 3950]KAG7448090.1 hypothetical protein BT62DRAFT_965923 [Guyanagaster necrorhizus MCA 3950]
MYHVFLGAPSLQESRGRQLEYRWEHIVSSPAPAVLDVDGLPPTSAALEAASRRISGLYENTIFQGDEEDITGQLDDECTHVDVSTMITWSPTNPVDNEERLQTSTISFLETSSSLMETQETQETHYSDTSSIVRFPTFHFNLHTLVALGGLHSGGSRKMNFLLVVLEVDGPDTIRTKRGPDAGKEISILKMILGDDEGKMCKLTAWREIADIWGGMTGSVRVKRGDIVFLENVTATCEPQASPALSASPYLKSKLQICYRTLVYTQADARFRPDLRLGVSDPSVRKVESLVRWFETMAGLNRPIRT